MNFDSKYDKNKEMRKTGVRQPSVK